MNRKKLFLIAILTGFFSISCDNTLQCERHIIPHDFIGKVVIYFNQKDGQKQLDKDGCIVYRIGVDGKCFSALPFKIGTALPGKTFRYFDIISKDSLNEIFDFNEAEYLKDVINNERKKYIFYISSGYTNPYYTLEYYVDYGMNYNKHSF